LWCAPLSLLLAQKPQVKLIQHQKFVPSSANNSLVLKQQIEQSYNKSGQVVREDQYLVDTLGRLQTERKLVHSYDSRGRHLNTLEYNADNNLDKEIKIYWDEKDNKTKVEQISYKEQQQVAVLTTYLLEYDGSGNKKTEKFYDKDGKLTKQRTWTYNKENEVISTETWIENKNQPRQEISAKFQRNKNGDLIKSVTIEKVNHKEFRKDICYFSNNYLIRWRKYLNGKFESEFINEYRDSVVIRTTMSNKRKVMTLEQADKYRRKMEKRKQREQNKKAKGNKKDEEEIWVTESEYDAYGNILVTTQLANDKVMTVTQYSYDDYGNRTRTLKVDKQKNTKEEERLEYDDYGNISKRVVLMNDRIEFEDRYKHEYYGRNE
jgi:hypothetical protein